MSTSTPACGAVVTDKFGRTYRVVARDDHGFVGLVRLPENDGIDPATATMQTADRTIDAGELRALISNGIWSRES